MAPTAQVLFVVGECHRLLLFPIGPPLAELRLIQLSKQQLRQSDGPIGKQLLPRPIRLEPGVARVSTYFSMTGLPGLE